MKVTRGRRDAIVKNAARGEEELTARKVAECHV